MDAVKFLQERNRMYKSGAVTPGYDYDPVSAVKVVEKWSAAHPRKTRQSGFLEQYPEANIGENGILHMCPAEISAYYRGKTGGCGDPDMPCTTCRSKFWTQEVE